MSALWAYTGAPDPVLDDVMSRALAHRSACPPQFVRTAHATIGVALASESASFGGIARAAEGGRSVGVVGRLRSGSSASDVLRRWSREGIDSVHSFPGEWIIALLDGERLSIVRDLAGVRTVYWGVHAGRVFVAVEPKGITAVPGFPRRLDLGAVAQFLTFSFVPGQRCSLRDLFELEAGHQLDIVTRTGSTAVARWFVHEDIDPDQGRLEDHIAATRSTIDGAVADRLVDGEAVGAFLSGGLDSSIVVASAAKQRRERGDTPPTTFSLHFGENLPNELEWSRAVAQRCATDHHELEVTPRDIAPLVRTMVWHLDEPIGDPVTVGNFMLARLAARHTGRVLNGEGGDPLFGGPKNLPMLLAHWYPTLEGPFAREEQYLGTWRRAGDEVFSLLHPDLRSEVDRERDVIDVVRPYFIAQRPIHFLNKLMVANMRLKGAHLILPKVDRMLGAHRLTPLSPLYDAEVLRLSLRIPPTAKLRNGVEKWILKQAYADMLPPDVINRPKSGMRVPVHWWFQGELRRLAKDVLSPRAVRRAGVFDPARVRDVLRYRTGRDGLRLWMLITFELWRRLVIDGESP